MTTNEIINRRRKPSEDFMNAYISVCTHVGALVTNIRFTKRIDIKGADRIRYMKSMRYRNTKSQ